MISFVNNLSILSLLTSVLILEELLDMQIMVRPLRRTLDGPLGFSTFLFLLFDP
jgi:hypothetical protein